MKKLLLILLCYPLIGFSQANYNITVNTNNAWSGNLFFQKGGQPIKPVKIIEAQVGSILKETDIVRFEDVYGRVK